MMALPSSLILLQILLGCFVFYTFSQKKTNDTHKFIKMSAGYKVPFWVKLRQNPVDLLCPELNAVVVKMRKNAVWNVYVSVFLALYSS